MTMLNVVQWTENEHEEIDDLVHTSNDYCNDIEQRQELAQQIHVRLRQHFKLDQNILYGAMHHLGCDQELLRVLIGQQSHILRLATELTALSQAQQAWREKLAELQALVECHFFNEERELFEIAKDLQGEDLVPWHISCRRIEAPDVVGKEDQFR